MAQNNSVFVWKTSNYCRRGPNLRNDLNQVTNMKSLGFTWKIIVNLLGVFTEVFLCDIDFRGFFDVAFDPHISSIVRFVVDRLAKLVLFVSVAEADDSPAPILRSSLLSPLLPPPLQCRTQSFFGHWRAHRQTDRPTKVLALFSCFSMTNN